MRTDCFVAYACTLYVIITIFAYLHCNSALKSTILWQNRWKTGHNDARIYISTGLQYSDWHSL